MRFYWREVFINHSEEKVEVLKNNEMDASNPTQTRNVRNEDYSGKSLSMVIKKDK